MNSPANDFFAEMDRWNALTDEQKAAELEAIFAKYAKPGAPIYTPG